MENRAKLNDCCSIELKQLSRPTFAWMIEIILNYRYGEKNDVVVTNIEIDGAFLLECWVLIEFFPKSFKPLKNPFIIYFCVNVPESIEVTKQEYLELKDVSHSQLMKFITDFFAKEIEEYVSQKIKERAKY